MGYTHGKKWADGEVEESIMNMVNTLKLDHFPTKSEMIICTKKTEKMNCGQLLQKTA